MIYTIVCCNTDTYTVICYGNLGNLGFIAYGVFALTPSRVLPTLVSSGRAQPPLRKFYHHSALKTAFFYHHLVFKIVFLPPFGLKNVQTDQILTATTLKAAWAEP